MHKFVRLLAAAAATGSLLLAPMATAKTHHHAKTQHHATVHHAAKAKSKTHKMTAQQRKMAECAHQSKGMKGKAHSAFMSKCLKKK